MLRELQARPDSSYVSPFDIATIYAGLGDRAKTLEYLEKAYQERVPYLVYLPLDPHFDPFRSDPRFRSLLHRIGLPAVSKEARLGSSISSSEVLPPGSSSRPAAVTIGKGKFQDGERVSQDLRQWLRNQACRRRQKRRQGEWPLRSRRSLDREPDLADAAFWPMRDSCPMLS